MQIKGELNKKTGLITGTLTQAIAAEPSRTALTAGYVVATWKTNNRNKRPEAQCKKQGMKMAKKTH